jgi:hypothetical protein
MKPTAFFKSLLKKSLLVGSRIDTILECFTHIPNNSPKIVVCQIVCFRLLFAFIPRLKPWAFPLTVGKLGGVSVIMAGHLYGVVPMTNRTVEESRHSYKLP